MAKKEFTTPVGRFVVGDLFVPNKTDMQGQPLLVKSGANKGQPTQQYICGLAFPKNDPAFMTWFRQVMEPEIRAAWPQWFAGPVAADPWGLWTPGYPTPSHPQGLSTKVRDGDVPTVDQTTGQVKPIREGHAGHWILKASSSFAPRVFFQGQYREDQMITSARAREVKRGYYGRIAGTMETNGNVQKPGMYVNLGMFDLCFSGQEISSAPDATQTFGASAGAIAMPAGATALPMPGAAPAGYPMPPQAPGAPAGYPAPPQGAPAYPQPPAAPGYPQPPVAAAPVYPPTGFVPPAAPGAPIPPPGMPAGAPVYVQPNPGIMGAAMPPMPGAAPMAPPAPPAPVAPPAPPAGPQMTAAANGVPYASYVASGWNDMQMRQAGLLV